MKPYKCSTCGGRLRFVAVEEDGDSTYICTRCGDEWFLSVIDPPSEQTF